MIVNASCPNSGVSSLLLPTNYNRNPCRFTTTCNNLKISSIKPSYKRILSFNDRSSNCRRPFLEIIKPSPSLGIPAFRLSAASSPLLHGEHGSLFQALPKLPKRQRVALSPRASKDVPYSYRYPAMTEKPKWWWRTLACLPYLMPLHMTCAYAETAYHLHPFLEDLEFLTEPFFRALGRLPSWFLMAYFFFAYLGVVRRKEWPHFFRFHVVMGMLLEISSQVMGTVSRWMPLGLYWGKIGMHFWTAMAFAYLFTVLECIRCALAGMYADVPFVCDAAYIQIPYD